MSNYRLLTVRQVAEWLGVHTNTVKRIPSSELPYVRVVHRGDRRYLEADVVGYLNRHFVKKENR